MIACIDSHAICDHQTDDLPPQMTILILLSPFYCTFSHFKVYYFVPTSNASSNVKPKVSRSKATFHNDFGFVTGWRPMVVVFCNNVLLVTDINVLNDSIFLSNKLGVNVGIILIYFLK